MATPPEPQDQAPGEGEGLLIVKVEDSSWEQDSGQQEDSRDSEACRQRFRQFCYGDAGGPHEAFSQLWELCCRWLSASELAGSGEQGGSDTKKASAQERGRGARGAAPSFCAQPLAGLSRPVPAPGNARPDTQSRHRRGLRAARCSEARGGPAGTPSDCPGRPDVH